MKPATEEGRLVAVETKLDVVIDQQKVITQKLDSVLPTFVTYDVLEKRLNDVNNQIIGTKNNRNKDLLIQTLITAPVSLLIGYFIANVFK